MVFSIAALMPITEQNICTARMIVTTGMLLIYFVYPCIYLLQRNASGGFLLYFYFKQMFCLSVSALYETWYIICGAVIFTALRESGSLLFSLIGLFMILFCHSVLQYIQYVILFRICPGILNFLNSRYNLELLYHIFWMFNLWVLTCWFILFG